MRQLAVALATAALVFATSPALAQQGSQGGAGNDYFFVIGDEVRERDRTHSAPIGRAADAPEDRYERRMWTPVCLNADSPTAPQDFPLSCDAPAVCPEGSRMYREWGLADGVWAIIGQACRGELPEAEAPEVTPGMVLRALRRLGLPEVEARTQPEGTTLVNFDTIFYAEATTQTRTVTLLGQSVTIEAEPVEFTWHPGDGTTRTTTTPGAPYPATDVTHRYATAPDDDPLRPHVDVTSRARYRLADGPWQPITETVTITGPPGTLRVAEATPALTR